MPAKSQLAGLIDQTNRDARARRDNPKCYTEPECWMPFRAPFSVRFVLEDYEHTDLIALNRHLLFSSMA